MKPSEKDKILVTLKQKLSKLNSDIRVASDIKKYSDIHEFCLGKIKGVEESIKIIKELSEDALSKDRFFCFVVSYWFKIKRETGKGKVNLLISTKEFPSKNFIKDETINLVEIKYDEPILEIKIVVENWIEMLEEDYNKWKA